MPYNSIKELPTQTKVLPKLAQEMWMRVFNRAIKTNTETKAFQIAWTVIKQFYRLNKSGKWTKYQK